LLDTDSIVFSHPKDVEPIKNGNYLGEMMREYKDFVILEFYSGGVSDKNK